MYQIQLGQKHKIDLKKEWLLEKRIQIQEFIEIHFSFKKHYLN